ncbi:MAG: acetate--CoA ligase family protein [Bacteriovoracaceae bacterium]|nr:acetate--CoA ligase family protein [Bacteriovoracaceae bacterium]
MIVDQLINPKSIVVVGGSNDTAKIGGKILKNLLLGGFEGDLSVVNPKVDAVQGIRCYPNVEQVKSNISLAIIALPAKFVKDSIDVLANKKGVKAFIVFSAGFSEVGDDGRKLEQEIVDIINKNNASLIGPNCIGVITPYYNGVFAGPIPQLNPQGIDFVSGSGATAAFIIEKGIPMGLSFSSLFSVGNSAQIGIEEVVKHWDETFDANNSSKIKLLYLENIEKPKLLLKHASSLIKKGCKIAAIKSGSSEAGMRAASSHTGALAGPDLAVGALFAKAGIVRCFGREELILAAAIFTHKSLKGKNLAIITHAGGPGVMLTDTLSHGGVKIPKIEGEYADELLSKLYPGSSVANPIDFLATGDAKQLGTIIDYVDTKFDNIDGMAVIFGSPGLFNVSDVYKVIHEKMDSCSKPIFPILPSIVTAKKEVEYFKSLGRTCFSDEVTFGNALLKVLDANTPKEQIESAVVNKSQIRDIIDNAQDGYISPEEIQKLLDAAGIPRTHEIVTNVLADAISGANKLKYPVVMKVVGPLHKTDVGGVVLNVKNDEMLRSTFDKLMTIKDATSVLIQPMVQGMELYVGAKYEQNYGHLILCGLGGVFIEALKDVSHALGPVDHKQAISMIKELKSYQIIQGMRGSEGVDESKFADIVVKLSGLLEAAPEIDELDLNPLLGTKEQVIAVDARIKICKSAPS